MFVFPLIFSTFFILRNNANPDINVTITVGKYTTLDEMIAFECPLLTNDAFICIPGWGARVITDNGKRIFRMDEINAGDVLHMVPTGFHFMYHKPIGVEFTTFSGKRMKQISYAPRILEFLDPIVSDTEISEIVSTAAPKMYHSMVGEKGEFSATRTSTNTVDAGSSIFQRLVGMVNSLLAIDSVPNLVEPMQVVRYLPGQFYMPHHDFFSNSTKYATEVNNGSNRFATVFVYLNDVPDGGQTMFPYSHVRSIVDKGVEGFKDECVPNSQNTQFFPKKGRAILFYSMHPNNTLDVLSQHGACAPTGAVKWAANLWVWNRSPMETDVCSFDGKVSYFVHNKYKTKVSVLFFPVNTHGCDTPMTDNAQFVVELEKDHQTFLNTYHGHLFRLVDSKNRVLECFVVGDQSL